MYILIAANGKLSLQDSDNLSEFSIREESSGAAVKQLSAIATVAENNHFWLEAAAVVEISGRQHDQQWVDGFWDMLAKVEAYGFSDRAKKRVKAHLDQYGC